MEEDLLLIKEAKKGNEACLEKLLGKYKSLASKIARRYFLAGQDEDDLDQESMIGLFKAFQSFNPNQNDNFKNFASLCINRQIQSAVKSANRLKNKALNNHVSLNNQGGINLSTEDEDGEVLYFIIPAKDQLPDDKLISEEHLKEIKKQIVERLSNNEKKILSLYLKGLSYKQIAEALKLNTKSIENGLYRIKHKLSFLNK